MVAKHQAGRVLDSRIHTPEPSIPLGTCTTQMTLLMAFGQDPDLQTASIEHLRSVLGSNRIPDGYQSRQDRNLTVIFSEDDVTSGPIREYYNSTIFEALNQPIVVDGDGMTNKDDEPTMAPTVKDADPSEDVPGTVGDSSSADPAVPISTWPMARSLLIAWVWISW